MPQENQRAKNIKIFDEWNEVKKTTSTKKNLLNFREKEIYYVRLGKNIGYEQNGKGSQFVRPVVVLRKYNKFMFTGISLTTSIKEDIFHYKFEFIKGKTSCASLSHIKNYDTKKLERKIGKISNEDFKNLKTKLKVLLKL